MDFNFTTVSKEAGVKAKTLSAFDQLLCHKIKGYTNLYLRL